MKRLLAIAALALAGIASAQPFVPGQVLTAAELNNLFNNNTVASFNGRVGAVSLTGTDISTALGYTPPSPYSAGTGLSLLGTQFKIANTAITAGTYGTAANVPAITFNAQGQATGVTSTPIVIANTSVTGLGSLSTQNASAVAITGGSVAASTVSATTGTFGSMSTTGQNNAGYGLSLTGYGTGVVPGAQTTFARGVSGTPTAVISGDFMSHHDAYGYNGTAFVKGGGTSLVAGSNWSGTSSETLIEWFTTPSGSATPVNTMTLSGTGTLTVTGAMIVPSVTASGTVTATTLTGTLTAGGQPNITSVGTLASVNVTGTATVGPLTASGAVTLSPANTAVSISPTGTGTVAISPAGALTVNPAAASTMDNVAVGQSTPLAGKFTTLNATTQINLNGKMLCSATAPTISSGFGTGAAIDSNNGSCTFRVNVGTGGTASSGVIGLPAAPTGWNCYVQNVTLVGNAQTTMMSASSTNSVTFTNYTSGGSSTAAWAASTRVMAICQPY